MDHQGAVRATDLGNLTLALGKEDLSRSNDRDLRSGCRGATVGVLQPELQGPARRHLEGEGGRKANPRTWRHGSVENKLAGRTLGMNSGGDNEIGRAHV